MARSRSGVPFIGKLLNSTTQPVYVLDSQRIIQFCNDACCAWTGLTEEQLLGVRCDYHTAPDGNETMRIAAGLCPPPEVYQGKACSALVGLRRPDGNFSQREARFTPFGGADGEVEAVLSIVDAFDRPLPPITSTAIESSELLHARLRKLRNSLGSQYRLEQLVGDSPASHRLREQVHVATTSESSVLILGSPGSGREHVARTIHYARSTGRTPLIPIDSELTDAGSLELALASASNPLTAVSTPSAAVSGTRDHGSAALLLLNLDKLPR
ncbi:MAG: Nitrogen fixation protein VnfA, partial [Planctomycetota bacterium]